MTAAARLFRVGRWHIRLAANTNSPQEVPSSQIRSSSTDFVMRGIVSKPSSWEEIKEKVNIGTVESLGTLGRLPDHIEIYRAFRKKVRHEIPISCAVKFVPVCLQISRIMSLA